MKKNRAVWISLMMLFSISIGAQAQVQQPATVLIPIPPSGLYVTYDKTTNLVFPYAIKSVDVGSKDVLVQLAKGVENILQVKAAKQGFSETNLTVVTADAKLYSYLLNYSALPQVLNIKVGSNMNYPKADALFTYKSDNEAKVYDLNQQISSKKPILKNINDSRNDVALSLLGTYIKDDKLYFQFALDNSSTVDYNIEALRFFIVDKKKSKRTALQEVELIPVERIGNSEIIRGNSKQNIVVTLSKFTIPDKKVLSIRLMELNGGRHLKLNIPNKVIVHSKVL